MFIGTSLPSGKSPGQHFIRFTSTVMQAVAQNLYGAAMSVGLGWEASCGVRLPCKQSELKRNTQNPHTAAARLPAQAPRSWPVSV
ncbi:MAG: hypothetical protein LBH43_10340 [Treponema sp.]|nr:hypothetical protein [Treponema sp.]